MHIIAISDEDYDVCRLEGKRPDVLISLGDLLNETIERAIAFYRPCVTLAVRGNHDVNAPFPPGVIDLHCTTHTFEGKVFGGFEGCWRYKPRGHHLFDQHEVSALMLKFPPVDIFVAHNSPAGIHERDKEAHRGFHGFARYIERHPPRWFFHGHQHVNSITQTGTTSIIGVYGEREVTV